MILERDVDMVFEEKSDIQKIKKDLRKKMLSKALSLPKSYKKDADARITQLLLGLPEYKLANTIFCFVGVEHEINTRTFSSAALA